MNYQNDAERTTESGKCTICQLVEPSVNRYLGIILPTGGTQLLQSLNRCRPTASGARVPSDRQIIRPLAAADCKTDPDARPCSR